MAKTQRKLLESIVDAPGPSGTRIWLLTAFLSFIFSTQAIRLGTNELVSGKVSRFEVPLTEAAKAAVFRSRNKMVETARAGIALPEGFDPAKVWPVLIVNTTSGGILASSIRAMDAYLEAALINGWVVLAADGPDPNATVDNPPWRWAMLSSVLAYLSSEWPGSRDWPIACGGFSGGAKWSALMAAPLVREKFRLIGIFMGGCNEDRASEMARLYAPATEYKKVPIFLSSGATDPIATPQHHATVKKSLERTGFSRVRLESYEGPHRLDIPNLIEALAWFREQDVAHATFSSKRKR